MINFCRKPICKISSRIFILMIFFKTLADGFYWKELINYEMHEMYGVIKPMKENIDNGDMKDVWVRNGKKLIS